MTTARTAPKPRRISPATGRRLGLFAVVIACAAVFQEVRRAHALGVPTLTPLAYSGSLLTFGAPDNATHSMILSLFVAGANDGGVGSAACTTNASVTCLNGQFSIPLSASCEAIVQQNQNLQSEVTVDNIAMGLISVTAVPYAIEAGSVASAATVGTTAPSNPTAGTLFYNTSVATLEVYDGSQWDPIPPANTTVPSGLVAWYAAPTCPAGWLEANGATVPTSSYSALYAAIGTTYGGTSTNFVLPELDGEFIRGWDHGRGVDPGRSFASFEWGSSIAYDGYFAGTPADATAAGFQDRMSWNNEFDDGFQGDVAPGTVINGVTVPAAASASNTSMGVAAGISGQVTNYDMFVGTRPRNVALLPCIKT